MKLKAPIVSLVAFPDAGRLIIDGTDAVSDGRGTVNKILSYHDPIYSQNECDFLFDLLKASNITSKDSRTQHIKDVQALRA